MLIMMVVGGITVGSYSLYVSAWLETFLRS